MSEKLQLDLDGLTLGEMEDFEKASGMAFMDAAKMGESMPVKAIIALVWIARRHDDPKFTLKDARAIKVSDLDFEPDPTKAKPASST